MHDLSELHTFLIARSDWNTWLKCHNTALYSLMKTFLGSELQITTEGLSKGQCLCVRHCCSSVWDRNSLHNLGLYHRATCSALVCVNKCVGSRINKKPSIIDGHLLMCMHLLHCSLLIFYWCHYQWGGMTAPVCTMFISMTLDKHKALIYYDCIITFYITCATKHI